MDIQQEIVNEIKQKLEFNFEQMFIEGLKRKGYEFHNRVLLNEFIGEHCKVVDSPNRKTFYVKDIPFLYYDYGVNIDMSNIENFYLTASLGNIDFL